MENAYQRWLEGEKEWALAVEREEHRRFQKYMLLSVFGCTLAAGAIGLLAGGDLTGILRNLGIGAAFGILCALFLAAVMLMSHPAKNYIKNLSKKVEEALTPGEREELALQMLGKDGGEPARRVVWTGSDKTREKVLVTKGYLLKATGRGSVSLVKMNQVERIELDAVNNILKGRGGGNTVYIENVNYLIHFYYKKLGELPARAPNLSLYFPFRDLRDQVVAYIEENDSQ